MTNDPKYPLGMESFWYLCQHFQNPAPAHIYYHKDLENAKIHLLLFFTSACFFSACDSRSLDREANENREYENEENEAENFKGAMDFWRERTLDVDLGVVPQNKLIAAIDEGKRRLKLQAVDNRRGGTISYPKWNERGPSNVGGRTRAIMIDKANHNRVWLGGVSGGLWRTEDITRQDPQYVKLADYLNNISISAIAQDPNNLQTIYVGTGEGYPNADAAAGTGIFKTTDDGQSWEWVPSTQNVSFSEVYEIYVHTNGDIYVCTDNAGILRSTDGAETWEKVLGTSLSGANNNQFLDFKYMEANQTFYASNRTSIFKSTTGARGEWDNIGDDQPGFPNNVDRIEFDVCPNDPDVIYILGNVGGFASNIYQTINGGVSWVSRAVPPIFGDYGQGWYDLDIAVDPFNCLHITVGGVSTADSHNQGLTFQSFNNDIHSDIHNVTYDPTDLGRVLVGCDGGIWFSEDYGQSTTNKSVNYVTTQFYGCAIHPAAGSSYVMGGAQDNGTNAVDDPGLSAARHVTGADGMWCFIDQTDPNIHLSSSQNGGWNISYNGGDNFGGGVDIEANWVDWSDYDNNAHILYGQVSQGGVNDVDFFRWKVKDVPSVEEIVDISNQNINVTAVLVDPNMPNRVYFGGQSGMVIKVDNADQGLSVQGTVFADLPGNASVSCIYMDKQTSSDVLISLNNYGSNLKNIWLSNTGGQDWNSIEGDLPDLPVYWAIFDPGDHDRAMIATEAGIWTTDDIDGDNTHWLPTDPANGMPFVRVSMLRVRDSDKVVLAGTYGRGMMTTDIFAAPAAVIIAPPVTYQAEPIIIDGSASVNAQSYHWDFGDFTTSDESKVTHTYYTPGIYTVSLTINGALS